MLFNFEKGKCLHTVHKYTGVNNEKEGSIVTKLVKENDLVVTIHANMTVSEQCRIAVSIGNQIIGMIRD